MAAVYKRRSSVNFGGQDIFARKYMHEKLTKCPNFTWSLPEKYIFPDFLGYISYAYAAVCRSGILFLASVKKSLFGYSQGFSRKETSNDSGVARHAYVLRSHAEVYFIGGAVQQQTFLTKNRPKERRFFRCALNNTEMAMGWVHPWVGLGWVRFK